MMKITLKVHRLAEDVIMPKYETDGASCFDLRAYLKKGDEITVWNKSNQKRVFTIHSDGVGIQPGDRILIPTGLIFDLDPTQSLRIHPRSSVGIKMGLTLPNCEGVVDADYTDQTYISLLNVTDQTVIVSNGDRLAQGEIFYRGYDAIEMVEVDRPDQKGNRTGGVGSTGKN